MKQRHVRASHLHDRAQQPLLRLVILRLHLLEVARQRSQVSTLHHTTKRPRRPVQREINPVFQHLQHAAVLNRLHFVMKPTARSKTVPKPGVSLAFQIDLGVFRTCLSFTAGIHRYRLEDLRDLAQNVGSAFRDGLQMRVIRGPHEKLGRRGGQRVGVDDFIAEPSKRLKRRRQIAERSDERGLQSGVRRLIALLQAVLVRIRSREAREGGPACSRRGSARRGLADGSERDAPDAGRASPRRRVLSNSPFGARCGAKRRRKREKRGPDAR